MELKLILQIVGFTLGLLYLWLEYRANIYLWLVGLVMPVVHGTLYFQTGLYADFGMNVYYFLGKCLWVAGMAQRSQNRKGRRYFPYARTPLADDRGGVCGDPSVHLLGARDLYQQHRAVLG